jgi:hypothetical protein
MIGQQAHRLRVRTIMPSSPQPPDLDLWLPHPAVRTRHRRDAPVDEAALWAAAKTVRLRDCRILGRLIRRRIPGLTPGLTFDQLFGNPPFNVLADGPTHRLSALCGRIWTVRGEFTTLEDPADFLEWREPGTVRVLFAHWAEPARDGSALISDVRIAASDRRGRLLLRGVEPFIAAFQGLVGTEPLGLAAQRAGGRPAG